jgi:CubicO group peptidase (beta-lactamase class C family)
MSRAHTWLALIVLAIGGVIVAILGLFAYVTATARPLHPDPNSVPSATTSAPPSKWTGAVEQARQIVRANVTDQNLPGLSVAVGVGGDIVWAEGFGWANLENKTRVAPDTRFRSGGTSIALTSAAVGLLVEKDQLKLDDEIQKYVPAFPQKKWPVTLGQLMAHVAGVRSDAGDEEPLSERCENTTDGLQRFADRDLLFEPGTSFRYSSYGWILVSAAVEAAAREPFFSYMRMKIFAPLSMNDTAPDFATEQLADRATFYYPRFAADNRYGPELAREGDYSCFAGAGAFLTTPSDLVRFGLAIVNGKLLQPATVKMLQTPQRLASGEETGYALGWDLETVSLAGGTTSMAGHDSEFTIGSSTTLATFPERGIVVAVMTNTSFADMSSLALKIAETFLSR